MFGAAGRPFDAGTGRSFAVCVLDLADPDVHSALESAGSAKALYESALASDYV